MASLQTLRNKGGVIVAVVIGLALLAFVLGDMLTSGSTLFGTSNTVGEIDGTTITTEQYAQQVNTLTEVIKVTTGSETVSAEQSQAIQQQAWEQLVTRFATTPMLNKIGIAVGVDEMAELITGRYASPMVQQLFTNPETGEFDAAYVRQFVSNISQDPSGRLQIFWTNLQNDVSTQAQLMKYKTLVDKGAYITAAQADFITSLESATYSVTFVADNFTSFADSTIQISESEIKAYYNNNQPQFKRSQSRSIEYVVFDALPSQADYSAAAKYMSELKNDFETTEEVKQFVMLNSQSPFDSRYYKEGELSGELGNFAFTATTAQTYAPEISGDDYVLARISDVKILPDSINFSHIVFTPDQKATADSLATILSRNSSTFANAAATYSLDQQSAANGGVVGTIDPQTVFAEFAEPLMAMKKGEVKLISLPTSLHLVKVNDVIGMSKKVQLGTIRYTVEPSETTRAAAFNRASTFANNARSKSLSQLAADSMLSKRTATLYPSQRELQGYKDSREVIRWSYNAKVGASSDVMEFGNSFVVVSLYSITSEGIAPLESVKREIREILVVDKKGEMLASKMQGGTVSSLAASLGVEPINSNDITFTSYLAPEVGFDPTFAGGICGVQKGATSKPIVGKSAVYVAQVNDVTSNPISSLVVRERLEAEQQQSAFYRAYQTLLENSNIVDERYKFY